MKPKKQYIQPTIEVIECITGNSIMTGSDDQFTFDSQHSGGGGGARRRGLWDEE